MPAAPNDRYVGLVLLFSIYNGEPLAILPDGIMQAIPGRRRQWPWRLKYTFPQELHDKRYHWGRRGQTRTQLMAACAVRDIKKIRCFSPNPERRQAFCKDMSRILIK